MLKKIVGLLITALISLGMIPETASASPLPVVSVIGDSFTAGWTGDARNSADAWYNHTANDLHWQVGSVVANPGGGFWTWGWFGTIYESLRDHPIRPDSDFVLLQAGLNDSDKDPYWVTQSVADVIGLIHQQAPNATIIDVGMLVPGQQGMTPARLNIARRLGDHQAIGDTRYMIAAMCTFEVSSDGSHPTKAGHQQIGDWVAWHIANGLDNGKPLQWNGYTYVV